MTTSDVRHSRFDLGDFRYATARYVKLLIRARWQSDPGFLSKSDLAAWKLPNVSEDTLSSWQLMQLAATELATINTDFIRRCSSGGIEAVDDTPAGRLIESVAFLVRCVGRGPEHNAALIESARSMKAGCDVDWDELVEWDLLPGIRQDLDQLPEDQATSAASTDVDEAEYLTPPQLARRMGIAPEKVIAWIRAGELQAVNTATNRQGRPRYLISKQQIEAFEALRTTESDREVKPVRTGVRRQDVIEFF